MLVYLRDLIDLPEHVRQGDFVLRLSEGVTKPDETLQNYVVTPQLAKCFDQALALVQSAVQGIRDFVAIRGPVTSLLR